MFSSSQANLKSHVSGMAKKQKSANGSWRPFFPINKMQQSRVLHSVIIPQGWEGGPPISQGASIAFHAALKHEDHQRGWQPKCLGNKSDVSNRTC